MSDLYNLMLPHLCEGSLLYFVVGLYAGVLIGLYGKWVLQ